MRILKRKYKLLALVFVNGRQTPIGVKSRLRNGIEIETQE